MLTNLKCSEHESDDHKGERKVTIEIVDQVLPFETLIAKGGSQSTEHEKWLDKVDIISVQCSKQLMKWNCDCQQQLGAQRQSGNFG